MLKLGLLSLPQAIVIVSVVLVIGGLAWKGVVPAAWVAGLIGLLVPSPLTGGASNNPTTNIVSVESPK